MDEFRLQLRITNKGEAVIFKYDGTRFANTNATIKLCSGKCYEFVFSSKRNFCPKSGTVRLRVHDDEGREPEDIDLKDLSRDQSYKNIWAMAWTCDLRTSKAGSRIYVYFHFSDPDLGDVTCPLVVKVYRPGDKSVMHGMALRCVDFRFQVLNGVRPALKSDELQEGVVLKDALHVPV